MDEICRSSGGGGGNKKRGGGRRYQTKQIRVWLLRLCTSVLVWTGITQLTSVVEVWHPRYFPKGWPSPCNGGATATTGASVNQLNNNRNFTNFSLNSEHQLSPPSPHSPPALLPNRVYKSNGYLRVSCNGGLNQMRAAICDMVTVARFLNLTLLVPQLDKRSFWADPSDFKDIFNVNHFINSLRDEVQIVKSLPKKFKRKYRYSAFSMPPISWSTEKYYLKQVLPLFRKHKVIHFNKTDARLANNGIPVELQRLRCRVNYQALRFTPEIEALGNNLISVLRKSGSFVVLHLRYEMDMLAFSGCTHGCSVKEIKELTRMRYAYPWWKEKEIVSEERRMEGLCPLTPEETALVLQALGFTKNTQIYIASGEIYGGEKRLSALRAAYPKLVRKEMLLSMDDLRPFQNHSTQMAALDYMVSVASDVFIPSYDGNMAKVVEGHRRHWKKGWAAPKCGFLEYMQCISKEEAHCKSIRQSNRLKNVKSSQVTSKLSNHVGEADNFVSTHSFEGVLLGSSINLRSFVKEINMITTSMDISKGDALQDMVTSDRIKAVVIYIRRRSYG